MVFKLTSHRNTRGFTILEYLVATTIGVMVLAAALLLWGYASQTCATLYAYVEMSSNSKIALDRISQTIRNSRKVLACSATRLTLTVPSQITTNTARVDLVYTNQALIQTTAEAGQTTQTKTLLTGCTNFEFLVYQRTPQTNSFTLTTNGFSVLTAKVIQLRWRCTRALRGDHDIIENQVSANVVIRSK
jgi:type II secretory pathway component PulJ